MEVVEEFGDAAETAESGVAGAGSVRENASFEDEDVEVGGFCFEAEGGVEADDTTADDDDIEIIEVGIVLPVAQLHLCSLILLR